METHQEIGIFIFSIAGLFLLIMFIAILYEKYKKGKTAIETLERQME